MYTGPEKVGVSAGGVLFFSWQRSGEGDKGGRKQKKKRRDPERLFPHLGLLLRTNRSRGGLLLFGCILRLLLSSSFLPPLLKVGLEP